VTNPDASNPEYSTDAAEEAQDVSTPDQESPEALSADVSYEPEHVEAEHDEAQQDDAQPVAAERPVISRSASDKPVQTVGRRKEAVVRVRLTPGNGKFQLNGKDLATYFPNKLHQQLIKDPFLTVEKVDGFDVFARLHGGGISGQAGALRLAIARALIEVNPDDRPALKAAGFLTRDARATERKKYGLKKARKAPQYSKR
jgi:small subunit ribosomal protein S9